MACSPSGRAQHVSWSLKSTTMWRYILRLLGLDENQILTTPMVCVLRSGFFPERSTSHSCVVCALIGSYTNLVADLTHSGRHVRLIKAVLQDQEKIGPKECLEYFTGTDAGREALKRVQVKVG